MRQVHDSLVVVAPAVRSRRWGRLGLRRGGRTGPVVVGGRLPGGATAAVLLRLLDHLELHVLQHVLLYAVHAVEVRVERVLTSVLLAALRTDDVRVLVAEVHVLDVPLQAHLVKILEWGRNEIICCCIGRSSVSTLKSNQLWQRVQLCS